MKYTNTHEWVNLEDNIATVGISNYAQQELGDVVYIEFPKVGDKLAKDEVACVIESTKAAVDIASPLTGKVCQINDRLKQEPLAVNSDPEGEGWLYKVEIHDQNEHAALLSLEEYNKLF